MVLAALVVGVGCPMAVSQNCWVPLPDWGTQVSTVVEPLVTRALPPGETAARNSAVVIAATPSATAVGLFVR